MNEFTAEKVKLIKLAIDEALNSQPVNPIAAFDADGTLWSCDMGEGLFQYQIDNRLVDLPPDPWKHYLDMHQVSPESAYLWLAQINAGLPLETVRQWAKEHIEKIHPVPVFEAKKEIISYLQEKGVETYVVTASIKWAVEPAAGIYGIPYERVIGISTKIKDGLVTEEQEGPITWRAGKVKGLLDKTDGKFPFFCAGNTLGDLPLLEAATHVRLVMASAKEGETNWESERKLITIAEERGWFHHSFV